MACYDDADDDDDDIDDPPSSTQYYFGDINPIEYGGMCIEIYEFKQSQTLAVVERICPETEEDSCSRWFHDMETFYADDVFPDDPRPFLDRLVEFVSVWGVANICVLNQEDAEDVVIYWPTKE